MGSDFCNSMLVLILNTFLSLFKGVLFTISTVIFIAFGDAELQPWAKEKTDKAENIISSNELLMYK